LKILALEKHYSLQTSPSPSFVASDGVFRVSECQSCSLLQKDLQVLVNKLKSMTEIISVLKDVLKCDGAMKQAQLPNSVCVCV